MKHIECSNDWSIKVSKPYKNILQLSLFKKTNIKGLGVYEWSHYFCLEEVKEKIHRLYIDEIISNYENYGSISNYKPTPPPKKYDGPKFDRYDYQISRAQLINYLVVQDRKLKKQERFINLLEDIDYTLRNMGKKYE